MAFPFITEANFEDGTKGHFDVETDTESRIDIAHYSDLARYVGLPAPYRGAYCARVTLLNDGTPADAYFQETGSWDMTTGTNDLSLRMMVYFSKDIVMANADEFAIMEFWSGATTAEAGVYVNYTTANGFRLGIGKGSASSFKPLTLGSWHCIEVFFDPAAAAGGTLDAWLDKTAFTQVAALTNANITSGVIGVVGQDAGTTTGTILFDEIVTDDARIFPPTDRFSDQRLLTASAHVFVGMGELESISLLSGGGTDNVLSVYDTDKAYTSDAGLALIELKNTANNEVVRQDWPAMRLQRGCYVALSGTNPRAMIKIKCANTMSDGAMRQHGLVRTANPFGA